MLSKSLYLGGNQLTNVDGLSNLANVDYLNLTGNPFLPQIEIDKIISRIASGDLKVGAILLP